MDVLAQEHDLYCIGIKSCGARNKELNKVLPKSNRGLLELMEEDTLIVGEGIYFKEEGKTILFMVTSNARMREVSQDTAQTLSMVLEGYMRIKDYKSIAMVDIFNNPKTCQDLSSIKNTLTDNGKRRITFYD